MGLDLDSSTLKVEIESWKLKVFVSLKKSWKVEKLKSWQAEKFKSLKIGNLETGHARNAPKYDYKLHDHKHESFYYV